MPEMATTLDCELFRDVFGSGEMRRVFDTRSMLQSWLDVEAALAAAEADAGVIPKAAADRIRRESDAQNYDLDELRREIGESRHQLVPVVRPLYARCGEEGAYVHWGATTQDITDTGLVLQIREALPWLTERVVAARSS